MINQEQIYDVFSYISFIFLIFTFIGLSHLKPQYIDTIDYYLKLYICLFLIIRFNNFQKKQFTNLDKKIASHAGFLILSSTFVQAHKETIRYYIAKLNFLKN